MLLNKKYIQFYKNFRRGVKSFLKFLFWDNFWVLLGSIVIFGLSIPAIQSGKLSWWAAALISAGMGLFSRVLSESYDQVNPFRGLFSRKK